MIVEVQAMEGTCNRNWFAYTFYRKSLLGLMVKVLDWLKVIEFEL